MSAQFPELVDPDDPTDVLVGDPHDPDAEVLDSIYRDAANVDLTPGKPYAPKAPLIQPRAKTRLLTGVLNIITVTDEAQMLLPADPDRLDLRIKVAPTAQPAGIADRILISDDRGKVQSEMGSFALFQGEVWNTNEPHTGPVWVKAQSIAAPPLSVYYIAVTR